MSGNNFSHISHYGKNKKICFKPWKGKSFTLKRSQTLSPKIDFQVIDFSGIPGAFDGGYNVTAELSHLQPQNIPLQENQAVNGILAKWHTRKFCFLPSAPCFFPLPPFLPSSPHFFLPSTSKRWISFHAISLESQQTSAVLKRNPN